MVVFPPLNVGCPLGFAPEAALEGLSLPHEGRGAGGAAAWVAGVLAAPGTQGSWRLGQQEVQCPRRVCILKSRDITLPTKVHLVKAMVFPVVMYGCESWTIKKAEHQRIHAFELWCW